MLGGLPVVPLATYVGQLGYTGLFLWTLELSWDHCGSFVQTYIDLGGKSRVPANYKLS